MPSSLHLFGHPICLDKVISGLAIKQCCLIVKVQYPQLMTEPTTYNSPQLGLEV